jgi:hypothetical protein
MAKTSKWTNRLVRLRSRDSREVFDQWKQSLTARADLLRYRMGCDFAGDIEFENAEPQGWFFFQPAELPSLCARLKRQFPSQANDIVIQAEKICRHQFDLPGYENLDFGREIDCWKILVDGREHDEF